MNAAGLSRPIQLLGSSAKLILYLYIYCSLVVDLVLDSVCVVVLISLCCGHIHPVRRCGVCVSVERRTCSGGPLPVTIPNLIEEKGRYVLRMSCFHGICNVCVCFVPDIVCCQCVCVLGVWDV